MHANKVLVSAGLGGKCDVSHSLLVKFISLGYSERQLNGYAVSFLAFGDDLRGDQKY